jgi:hypothetical protein
VCGKAQASEGNFRSNDQAIATTFNSIKQKLMNPSLLKRAIRSQLGDSRYVKLRRLAYLLNSIIYKSDLVKLGRAFNSDKATFHSYAKHYQEHFHAIRNRSLNILEIGIGGYQDLMSGGESLRMWKSYFPCSRVYGIDIHDKTMHDEPRIKTFRGSQADEAFLRYVADQIGPIDIIIDDGSHVNEHVIKSFSVLFPLLKLGGIYAIEDLQTSYWDESFGGWGGSQDLSAAHTSMNFLKSLTDGLNYQEFTNPDYVPSYFDKTISSIHFYHNLAFVYKNPNLEPTNRFNW